MPLIALAVADPDEHGQLTDEMWSDWVQVKSASSSGRKASGPTVSNQSPHSSTSPFCGLPIDA